MIKKPVAIGDRFGKLTVVDSPIIIKGKQLAMCRCDCGTTKLCNVTRMRIGMTKSCGCLKHHAPQNVKHGYSKNPKYKHLYFLWKNMKNRCYNPNKDHFDRYGGRGIAVCDEWRNSAKCFIEWALSNGWCRGLELDRIDNDGNYDPANCRFISHKKNSNNTRRTMMVLYNGESLPFQIALERSKTSLSMMCVYKRMKRGLSFEDALVSPCKPSACVSA